MKALLMYPDADFDLARPAPWNEAVLTQDLRLDPLCRAMAQGDEFLLKVARAAVLASATNPDTILYRQAVLRDCLNHRDIVLAMYRIAVDAIERERKEYFGILGHTPGSILSRAITVMTILSEHLTALRKLIDSHGDKLEAAGFRKLFATLRAELDAEFFEEVEAHLKGLRLRDGVLVSARLGKGLKGDDFILRRTNVGRWHRVWQLFKRPEERVCTVYIHPRDQAGGRILGELRDRGVNLVANALAQSVDHVLSFFWMLRTELAFYIGCANLHAELERRGQPTCFPVPVPLGERGFSCQGLYDASLALAGGRKVVGNDVNADDRLLVIITGANQGGKSTFLRSVGLAQLMMQCGMFVPAEAFCASVCDGLFTHYKREEDATMTSGKFDEELKRMSEIVDHLTSQRPPISASMRSCGSMETCCRRSRSGRAGRAGRRQPVRAGRHPVCDHRARSPPGARPQLDREHGDHHRRARGRPGFTAAGHSVIAGIALIAGLYDLINHSFYKALLFTGAGVIDARVGTTDMDRSAG